MATTTFLDIVASFLSSPPRRRRPLRRLRFNNENRNALRRANNDEEGEEKEEIMVAVDCCLILFSFGEANIRRLQLRLGLLADDEDKEVAPMDGNVVDCATRQKQKSKNIDTAAALFVVVSGCAFSKTFFIVRRRRFLSLEEEDEEDEEDVEDEEEIKVENDIDAVCWPNPTNFPFVDSIRAAQRGSEERVKEIMIMRLPRKQQAKRHVEI